MVDSIGKDDEPFLITALHQFFYLICGWFFGFSISQQPDPFFIIVPEFIE